MNEIGGKGVSDRRGREITLDYPALAEVLEVYEIGAALKIGYIEEGRVNQNYDLLTETGRYVLRRSSGRRVLKDVIREHHLIGYLDANGFPTPPLVRTRDGADYYVSDDRIYRVTRFVEGSKYDPANPSHLREVARTLARYHGLVRLYEGAGQKKEAFRPILDTLREGLRRSSARGDEDRAAETPIPPDLAVWPEFFRAQLARVVARLEEGDRQEELPRTMIHGSCRVESFIFRGDGVAAMLDYDNGYADVRVLDIAIALLSFALIRTGEKDSFDPALITAFLEAYQSVEPMSPTELSLVPWYMRARILKRELGRYGSYLRTPRATKEKKLRREAAKLAWLDANEARLASIFEP